MPTQVSICGRTVTLTYPNKSLRQLEEKTGVKILGKADPNKVINIGDVVTDTAAWLWAGSLKDPGGALDYDDLVKTLDDMTLRETGVLKDAIEKEFAASCPETKENPPAPASPQN